MYKKLISLTATLQLLVALTTNYGAVIVHAEDAPNKDAIRNEINQQIQQSLQNAGNSNTSSNTGSSDPTPSSQPTDSSTDVTNTGDDVTVDNANAQTSATETNQTNNADVNSNVKARAITGQNEASRNISINGDAGVIHTGDAIINVSGEVNANTNNAQSTTPGNGSSAGSSVKNTGDRLSTSTNSDSTTYALINQNNNTRIHSVVDADADTGNNHADGNIALGGGVAGEIITGNAIINTSYLVTANGNVAIVGGSNNGAGPGAGASIYVANTGNLLGTRIRNTLNNQFVINQTNNSRVSMTCGTSGQREKNDPCSAITGGNASDGNINRNGDAGVIHTGDAVVNVELDANVNHNSASSNNTGNEGSSTSSDVVNTGDNVGVDTQGSSDTSTNINQTNNASVDFDVDAQAITGRNHANGNIAYNGNAGVITTGNAIINVGLKAELNTNDAVSSDPSAGMSTGAPQAHAQGEILNTGDDNGFSLSATTTRFTTINQVNNFDFQEWITTHANTGNNSTDRNIGSGSSIKTGDAVIGVTTDITANTNYADPYNNGGGSIAPTTPPAGGPTGTPGPTNPPVATINGESRSIGGSSTSGSSNGSTGSVLGAMLPATGATDTFTILIAAGLLAFVGIKLRKFAQTQ